MSSIINLGRKTRRILGSLFGHKHLLITNAIISTFMGTLGDGIEQNYDIITKKKDQKNGFNWERSLHMSIAGLTTGIGTHFWYIALDSFMGRQRTLWLVSKKVLVDQIIYSPINFTIYFGTVGILEKSNWKKVKQEIVEKGMQNIYIVEWFVWTPAQFFNFYVLPMRYRVFFDNVISLGFDIYSPYVKYKTPLSTKSISNFSESSLDKSQLLSA